MKSKLHMAQWFFAGWWFSVNVRGVYQDAIFGSAEAMCAHLRIVWVDSAYSLPFHVCALIALTLWVAFYWVGAEEND